MPRLPRGEAEIEQLIARSELGQSRARGGRQDHDVRDYAVLRLAARSLTTRRA
jgi:hypothetical protein